MNTAILAMKAIMIIWHSAGTNSQAMTSTRFDTYAECQAARSAILQDKWAAGGDFVWLSPSEINCIPYQR